ncbi:MAG: hypothetical protein M3292_12500, partial [Actinomycetota bacterium]|nr:hypothetical protein [Actinomycetota bacterium]
SATRVATALRRRDLRPYAATGRPGWGRSSAARLAPYVVIALVASGVGVGIVILLSRYGG